MHYSFPSFTLTFNALHFSAFLLVPARHSFACRIFPPFRRIYSVVRQWKKHLSSVTKVLPRLLSAAYGPSRLCTLRDPLRRLYLAPRRFTRRMHARTHAHTHMRRKNPEIAISSPTMNNDGIGRLSEKSCIRSLHRARSEIYGIIQETPLCRCAYRKSKACKYESREKFCLIQLYSFTIGKMLLYANNILNLFNIKITLI